MTKYDLDLKIKNQDHEKNKKTYVIIGLLVVILVAIVSVGLNRSSQVLKAETLENVTSSQQNATSTQDKSSASSTQQTNKNKTTAIASLPQCQASGQSNCNGNSKLFSCGSKNCTG